MVLELTRCLQWPMVPSARISQVSCECSQAPVKADSTIVLIQATFRSRCLYYLCGMRSASYCSGNMSTLISKMNEIRAKIKTMIVSVLLCYVFASHLSFALCSLGAYGKTMRRCAGKISPSLHYFVDGKQQVVIMRLSSTWDHRCLTVEPGSHFQKQRPWHVGVGDVNG